MRAHDFCATQIGLTGHIGPMLFTAVLAVAGGALAASATARPYDYRLILRVAPHRLLTPAFRDQLRAELQDGLQAALGPLARIEVVTANGDPSDRWPDLNTLDTVSDAGPLKRHFVEVS